MKNNQLTILVLLLWVFSWTTVTAQDENRRPGNIVRNDGAVEKEDAPTIAPSVVFVVNDNGDGTDATPGNGICETATGNGLCTLRAAVTEANSFAGNDTIVFDPGITSISLAAGQISITSNINIIGNGASNLTIQNIAALSTTSRIFNITNFVVNLSGMTISGGNVSGNGGGLQNTGTLTITNCVIRDNRASAVGGGVRSTNNLTIYNSVIRDNISTASTSGGISFAGANLTVRNTTINNNISFGNGGGMNISATASVTISHSTINNNTAGASSGGLFTNRGTITNTTISGNVANGALAADGGGGLRIQAGTNSVSLISCTITNNNAPNSTAGARSGIWHETGTLNLSNTIVAANSAQDIQRDGTGVIVSNGFNLIGENTSVTTEFPGGLPNGTNYVGTDALPLDPMIAPLANNGGATNTHALLAGSLAIDKGSAFGTDIDQRAYLRPIDLPGVPDSPTGDGTDIGAFEFQSAPNPAGFSVSGRILTNTGSLVGRVTVVLTDGLGNTRTALSNRFGFFRFENVAAGESYLVSGIGKEYLFTPQIITANGNIEGLEITALP